MYTVLWLRFLYCDWGFCAVTEVFVLWLRFFLPWLRFFRAFSSVCKANVRVKLAKTGHGHHPTIFFVLFGCYLCCTMYCLCVNVYCHRMETQLQLINISYLIFTVLTLLLSVLYGSQNRQRLLLYTSLTDWFFITVVESVYSAVRTDSLYKADYVLSLKV